MQENFFKPFQKPVFFDQDGATDDFISLITLLTIDGYRVNGISITNANCFIDSAAETTLRILDLFCRNDIEISLSHAKSTNPFPIKWRESHKAINKIKLLSGQKFDNSKISRIESAEFTAKKILEEEEKTTVIVTGPASNIAKTILKFPEVKEKIECILWVGGAFLADGNVIVANHDGSAEWNIFWDSESAIALLESGIPIKLFPLDVGNEVSVDAYLMYHLEKNKKKKLSKLVLRMLEPNFNTRNKFFIHDVLPSLYLRYPDIFIFESTSICVEHRGTSRGNIYRSSKGGRVKYAKFVIEEEFYDNLIKQLKQF